MSFCLTIRVPLVRATVNSKVGHTTSYLVGTRRRITRNRAGKTSARIDHELDQRCLHSVLSANHASQVAVFTFGSISLPLDSYRVLG